MLADIGQNKKVAGFGSEPAAVPFFRNPNTRTGIDAGRNPDLDLLRLWRYAFAAAQAARLTAAACALAIRTTLGKLQTPAGPHHLSRAFARRTLNDRPACVAGALAA